MLADLATVATRAALAKAHENEAAPLLLLAQSWHGSTTLPVNHSQIQRSKKRHKRKFEASSRSQFSLGQPLGLHLLITPGAAPWIHNIFKLEASSSGSLKGSNMANSVAASLGHFLLVPAATPLSLVGLQTVSSHYKGLQSQSSARLWRQGQKRRSDC